MRSTAGTRVKPVCEALWVSGGGFRLVGGFVLYRLSLVAEPGPRSRVLVVFWFWVFAGWSFRELRVFPFLVVQWRHRPMRRHRLLGQMFFRRNMNKQVPPILGANRRKTHGAEPGRRRRRLGMRQRQTAKTGANGGAIVVVTEDRPGGIRTLPGPAITGMTIGSILVARTGRKTMEAPLRLSTGRSWGRRASDSWDSRWVASGGDGLGRDHPVNRRPRARRSQP